jgi:hypothetical protein
MLSTMYQADIMHIFDATRASKPRTFRRFQGMELRGSGGEGGIRTHGGLAPTAVFKTAALNHSATSPASGGRT